MDSTKAVGHVSVQYINSKCGYAITFPRRPRKGGMRDRGWNAGKRTWLVKEEMMLIASLISAVTVHKYS